MVELENPSVAENEVEARRAQARQQDNRREVNVKSVEKKREAKEDDKGGDDPWELPAKNRAVHRRPLTRLISRAPWA